MENLQKCFKIFRRPPVLFHLQFARTFHSLLVLSFYSVESCQLCKVNRRCMQLCSGLRHPEEKHLIDILFSYLEHLAVIYFQNVTETSSERQRSINETEALKKKTQSPTYVLTLQLYTGKILSLWNLLLLII